MNLSAKLIWHVDVPWSTNGIDIKTQPFGSFMFVYKASHHGFTLFSSIGFFIFAPPNTKGIVCKDVGQSHSSMRNQWQKAVSRL